MVPPDLNFWSISRRECLETQQKDALKNGFLRTPLFSNDTFDPGYNHRRPIRKGTSILDKGCFNFEQLFDPLQCTACKKCQDSSKDKLILSGVTGMLSTSNNFFCP